VLAGKRRLDGGGRRAGRACGHCSRLSGEVSRKERPRSCRVRPAFGTVRRERGEGVHGSGREVEFKEPGLYAHIVCLLIRWAATATAGAGVSRKEPIRSRRVRAASGTRADGLERGEDVQGPGRTGGEEPSLYAHIVCLLIRGATAATAACKSSKTGPKHLHHPSTDSLGRYIGGRCGQRCGCAGKPTG
jgi:hypothetical protein